MLYDAVRPKLRLDTTFLPTADGVFFRSRGHVFTLKGRGIYELMSRLAPHLSGDLTIGDICHDLDPDTQSIVRKLLQTLVVKKVVIDRVTEHTSLSPSVQSMFRAQIDFIEHYSDRPQYRFSRLREANVFVTGSGAALSSMCVALVRNGVRTITVDRDVPRYNEDRLFASEVNRLRAAGIDVTIEHSPFSSRLVNLTDGPTVICFASVEPDFEALFRLNDYSLRNDIVFVPGYVLDGQAVIGPSVRRQPGCLTCSLLRRTRHMSSESETELWRGIVLSQPWMRDVQPDSCPSVRILGHLVAFEVFKSILAQFSHEASRAITSIDLETLETTAARLFADPACPDCRSLVTRRDSWVIDETAYQETATSLTLEEQLSAVEPAVNPQYGLFHSFDDDHLIQTPLFRSAIVVRKGDRTDAQKIYGYSIVSNAAARVAAFLEAATESTFEPPDISHCFVHSVL